MFFFATLLAKTSRLNFNHFLSNTFIVFNKLFFIKFFFIIVVTVVGLC
jgi:hypothetical protein